MTCAIKVVRSGAERRRFEALPEMLHGKNPAYVPPFPGAVARMLAGGSAFHRVHGRIFPFLAERGGRMVGRIAAIVNRTHTARYRDGVAFFGFFDCENDPATAAALVRTVAEHLRSHGFETMRGPYNPSINDESGLLVEGADQPPCIGLTWNPLYYAALLEGAGLGAVRTTFGYDLPLAGVEVDERIGRLAERVARRSSMRLRPINLDRLERELPIIQDVYNHTLERNWGFVPISLADLMASADGLRAIADPEMILIAERDGEPAGVALSLPNINELLIHLKGLPRWQRPLKLAWLLRTRRIRMGRQVVYGIHPRFRDRGLHAWLLREQFVAARARFESAQLGWIEENNTEIIGNSLALGAIPRRTWKIYELAL